MANPAKILRQAVYAAYTPEAAAATLANLQAMDQDRAGPEVGSCVHTAPNPNA